MRFLFTPLVRLFLFLVLVISINADSFASPTPLPEAEDGPLLIWKEKAKFYLVIAVNNTGVKGTRLPFALTDGQKVVDTFNSLGYKPLITKQPLFLKPNEG